MSNYKYKIRRALDDIEYAYRNRSIWISLGLNDVRNRYNRSKLGIFWSSLSILIFVGAIGPIYAVFSRSDISVYMPHLLLGLVVWNFLSGVIAQSGREFIESQNIIISFQISYFTILMRVVWRNLVVLMYQMIVFIAFALYFNLAITKAWLMVPFALIVICINASWISLLVSLFSTRFRDIPELVNNVVRLLFFVTPIMWMPRLHTEMAFIADMNPFYYLIELLREPLLVGTVSYEYWVYSLLMTIAGWLVVFPLFVKFRSRISFWI